MKISGKLVDIHNRDIYGASITIGKGRITRIEKAESISGYYIIPGLTDAHIHIESSMITPGAFAAEAVRHGTVAVVSDPHEIANVCGREGVDFMIDDGKNVPLKFLFGAPSCVPATNFETSGGIINKKQVEDLLAKEEIHYLSEMMNFPGVIFGDEDVCSKISSALKHNKPVDGHAPGLRGEDLKKYISAGISTDHECSTLEEALEKLSLGMKILIREGSAAKNLENLKSLIRSNPEMVMLCSDDLHPEMLLKGHINKLVSRLIKDGYDLFDVLRSVTLNPANHYKTNTGLLRVGDAADFILVDSIETMDVLETWIDGQKVFDRGIVSFKPDQKKVINRFNCGHINSEDIVIRNNGGNIRVIEAMDGELVTNEIISPSGSESILVADISLDFLKIIVKDRYNDAPPQAGFIKGFNLKKGAFASSVSHDSHNIICVGTNDYDITAAVNTIADMKGGLAVSVDNNVYSLQLDIGGIMTSNSCRETAGRYDELSNIVRKMGCTMSAPFMTLAFMALLVIPDLKIGDKGLFDVNNFRLVPLFC